MKKQWLVTSLVGALALGAMLQSSSIAAAAWCSSAWSSTATLWSGAKTCGSAGTALGSIQVCVWSGASGDQYGYCLDHMGGAGTSPEVRFRYDTGGLGWTNSGWFTSDWSAKLCPISDPQCDLELQCQTHWGC